MYNTVALAGTFDRLHKGHLWFLSHAFKSGHKVIIGLTSDEMANKKFSVFSFQFSVKHKIQNFQTRRKELQFFLKTKGFLNRSEIVKIEDVYGTAVTDDKIEALVVTSETIKGGRLVNKRRRELGMRPLKLIRVALVPAEDRKRISSTRIRLGEIDRWGRVVSCQLPACRRGRSVVSCPITENLRQKLKKPQGILIEGDPDNHKYLAERLRKAIAAIQPILISTVGDEVTKLCNEIGTTINLAIFDFRVKREKKYKSLNELGFVKNVILTRQLAGKNPLHDPENGRGPSASPQDDITVVRNPPGYITPTLIAAIRKAYRGIVTDGQQRLIKVIGEDDLSGVPAILLAPLGTVVIYGQPDMGVVLVEVTEEKKRELMRLIENA